MIPKDIVNRLLAEDGGIDPSEVERIADTPSGRLKWWVIPALFVVKAPDRYEAEDIAGHMQGAANHSQQTNEYGGMLFLDEDLPTVEIREGPGEEFDQHRPGSMVGYVPGVVNAQ